MGGARIANWLSGYGSALSRRDLRRLFGGLVISATGTWAYHVALLAFVFERTHSLAWVGAAGLARLLPQLLLSVYGGVLAERSERIRLMVASDLLSGFWRVGIAIVAATDELPAPSALMATARGRLAVTHPSRSLTYAARDER